jgi:putative inorganic carbon (hco3(-)) transporter
MHGRSTYGEGQALGVTQRAARVYSSVPQQVREDTAVKRWRIWEAGMESLVVAVMTPFVALTQSYVQRILLAVIVLDIPLQFGTHLFYNEKLEEYGAMGGLSVSAATLALVGLYLGWFTKALANPKGEDRGQFHVSAPLLVYLGIAILSIFVAADARLASFETCLFLESLLLYIYIANCVRSRQDTLFVVTVLLAGGLIESLVVIVLSFTGMPSTIWGLPTHIHIDAGVRGGYMRTGGTLGSPNSTAAYLSILLSMAASMLFTSLGRLHKLFACAVLVLSGIALVLTFSRGGWIALVVSLGLLCLCVGRQRGLSLRGPIAVIAILALLYLPFHSLISQRLFSDDRGSAESRIPLMRLSFRIFADNPVLGVGANNFSVVMGHYLTPEFRHAFLYAVHNKYLLVLCETGIGGLLAFLAFLWATIRKGWQCWTLKDSFLSPLALGVVAGIAGHMVHMTVDVFRGRPIQQMIWLLAGLLVAMHRMLAEPSRSAAISPGA